MVCPPRPRGTKLGIIPCQVYAQAYKSHLAASAAKVAQVEIGNGYGA